MISRRERRISRYNCSFLPRAHGKNKKCSLNIKQSKRKILVFILSSLSSHTNISGNKFHNLHKNAIKIPAFKEDLDRLLCIYALVSIYYATFSPQTPSHTQTPRTALAPHGRSIYNRVAYGLVPAEEEGKPGCTWPATAEVGKKQGCNAFSPPPPKNRRHPETIFPRCMRDARGK